MKKSLILSLVLLFVLTSCFPKGESMFLLDSEKLADETFSRIIDAIEQKDDSTLVKMFSGEIRTKNDLSNKVLMLFDFIRGDIVSASTAYDGGVGTYRETDGGKMKTEIESAFCIETTKSSYYIAIKECVKDESNENNIGLLSVYIIESEKWTENCVYRGDGKWTQGINIE